MRSADVARLDIGTSALGRDVLEQLDHVVVAGDAEMRHANVRVGIADDRREIPSFLLLRRDHLATEDVAVEDERAVEVGDCIARVVRPAKPPAAIASRSSTPPPGVTTKMFSTRAP